MASTSDLERRLAREEKNRVKFLANPRHATVEVSQAMSGQDTAVIVHSLNTLHGKIDRIDRSKKNKRMALLVGALAIASLGFVFKDKISNFFPQKKPESVSVPSVIPLIDSSGAEVTGALTFELSTHTETRQLADGVGKALLVNVSVQTNESYADTTLGQQAQLCLMESLEAVQKGCAPMTPEVACVSDTSATSISCLPPGEISADVVSIRLGMLDGTENEWLCISQMSGLATEVKANAELFENSTFSALEIADASTVHEVQFMPFTEASMPDVRNEIIFVIPKDLKLTC